MRVKVRVRLKVRVRVKVRVKLRVKVKVNPVMACRNDHWQVSIGLQWIQLLTLIDHMLCEFTG